MRRLTATSVAVVFSTAGLFLAILVLPAAAQDELCAECHEGSGEMVAASIHGFLECVECHAGFDEAEHPEESELMPDCGMCHDDAAADFEASIHGQMMAIGELNGDACASCHGAIHNALPADDLGSTIHPTRLAQTCGTCHSDPRRAEELGVRFVRPIEAYEASVHAQGVAAGENAATCNDCHDSHAIYPASDMRSKVFHRQVPQTCAKCHQNVADIFAESVHGKAAAHGIRQSPVCTDCHGEHRILGPQDRESPVYASNIPKQACERCHADLRLSEMFGLSADKVPAYQDSYHGLAARAGSITVANCSSCHGVHDILPSWEEASHTNESRLGETCGQCHPGAGERFAIGPVHVLATEIHHAAVYWVRQIYIWLIVLTIGGMVLHNVLDLYQKAKHPIPRPAHHEVPGRERMSRGFRAAHVLLMTSFMVLVYTGFALTYPDAWWTTPFTLFEYGGTTVRANIHRVAAIVMLVSGFVHILHLWRDRTARRCIAAMIPNGHDVRELKERIAFFLGRSPEPPKAPWVGYPEKMEYLAVIWGTIVMAVTGFVLWFETPVLKYLPSWVADVSTVVHFYEAILASLAILVWHFYAVFFDPLVYPMDTAWLTGRSAPGREAERLAPGAEPKKR